jgi:hypothetical protein
MARKTEGPYAHPRQMPHEVKSHFNLSTGGYSVHEHDAGTTERNARAVLLLRSYGEVRRHGHELFARTKGPIAMPRRWNRVQTGPDEAECVPSGMLDVPVVLEMGERSLYAWSVGTRASQAATRAALAEAREGRGGWMPALFDAATGCFAAMGPDRRSAGCLPNDRSVDVLLTLRPNVLMPRPPGIGVDLCRPLYRPAKGAWKTPLAFAPAMYYRPAARENPSGSYWSRGGCLEIATQIRKILPGAKLVDLVEPEESTSHIYLHSGSPHHVVVAWRGLYIDYEGAHDPTALLNRWNAAALSNGAGELHAEPHNAARAKDFGLKKASHRAPIAAAEAWRIVERLLAAPRENPALPCGSVIGSFRSRKEAEKALRAMQGATGGTLRIVRR